MDGMDSVIHEPALFANRFAFGFGRMEMQLPVSSLICASSLRG